MVPFRLYATTGEVVARLDSRDGTSVQTTIVLGNEQQSHEGHIVNGVMCHTVRVPGISARGAVSSRVTEKNDDKSDVYSATKGRLWNRTPELLFRRSQVPSSRF